MDFLQHGDRIDAVGLPIVADVGMLTIGGFFEFAVLDHAVENIQQDLADILG